LSVERLFGGEVQARLTVVVELALFLVGWGLSRILFTPAMALQAMVLPAFIELACRLGAILVALGFWLQDHPSLPLMLVGFPISSLVLLCFAVRNAASHGAALPSLSRKGIVPTWRQTLPFAASEVLNQFYARADLLLIAYLLGHADVGLYATDIKFIEVGLIPLVLLGTAAYPLLSRYAVMEGPEFLRAARDLVRTEFLLSGWLAVAMCTLIPLLIVPIFGAAFEPAAEHLPWFSVLALVKAAEIALYRLLYCVHRQTTYAMSLSVGTVLIVALNFVLIPNFGIKGAVAAGICSVGTVACICAVALRDHISLLALLSLAMRQAVALAAIAAVFVAGRQLGLGAWANAIVTCCAFPVAALVAGLVLNPSSSNLFEASRVPPAASHAP
jgi:O-antigen/teichoic acid export membrane protein